MRHYSTDATNQPAFVIDLDGPALSEANAKARALWGLAETDPLPRVIDAAMPAIAALANIERTTCQTEAPDQAAPCRKKMEFWTNRGTQHLSCALQRQGDANRILVIVDEAGADQTPDADHTDMACSQDPGGPAAPASVPHTAAAPPVDLRTMAHELRTPISAVIALADMIDQEQFGPLGDPRYREYARDIRDSAHLALNIVAAALEHDQHIDAILPGGISEIDPALLLRKARRALRLNAQDAGLAIEINAAPDLPHIHANPPALTQILLNLTANAIKFTPPGGYITLAAGPTRTGGLTIAIADTGIGMTELETSVLVEGRNGEGDGTETDAGGQHATADAPPRPATINTARRQGIGFTLVRRLAAAMGAALDVASERGVGTRVSITFPPSRVVARPPSPPKLEAEQNRTPE